MRTREDNGIMNTIQLIDHMDLIEVIPSISSMMMFSKIKVELIIKLSLQGQPEREKGII